MTDKTLCIGLTLMLASALQWNVAYANEHTQEALQHATEAAQSAGDAKAIAEHASKALKHIEDAKTTSPEMAKKLEKSEADLKSAVNNASRYNTDSAAKDAADAKARLEAIRLSLIHI